MKNASFGKPMRRTAKAWRNAQVAAREHVGAAPKRKPRRKTAKAFFTPPKP
jgi:hypothetical protein